MGSNFDDADYWKAIVLYGLNQATYKIGLGKTIIELASEGANEIDWSTLSVAYFNTYLQRLTKNPLPQQNNPSRRTVMERIVESYQLGKINFNEAVTRVETEAFNDVVPRFQTIGTDRSIVGEKFYHFEHGKKLYLHDSVFKIEQERSAELLDELDARWGLLEGAFSIIHGNWELTNDVRDIYIRNGYERTNITHNIPFLQGYQGNICFYCAEEMVQGDIHVDHLIPRQFMQHDEIWNLVLSHSLCNMHKSDSLVGKHYLEKLIARNENIMGSNHPWKKKIADSLGTSPLMRAKAVWKHYDNARIALKNRFWENSPSYNRETDPFFRKLITQLNNK
jgi:hypothetical protein